MLLSEALDRYKADRIHKGFSTSTIRGEQSVLRSLLAVVGNIQVSAITVTHMDRFWSRHTDWSAGTWNKARTQLNTFFQWCQARGMMPKYADPLDGTRARKQVPRDHLIIPQAEWPALLDAATDPRDRAIVAIGLYLFTRISETVGLRWSDIDFQNHVVTVTRPKTYSLDVLPICSELEHELRVWRLAYSELMGSPVRPSWYVIPSYSTSQWTGVPGHQGKLVRTEPQEPRPNRPPSTTTALGRVQKVMRDAGYDLQKGEGSHTLRRSGANALYNELSERGHDRAIRMCQAMLGHASIQTTEVYLALNLDRKARNDLLAGKRMFTGGQEATVIQIGGADGQANTRAL